MDTAQIDQINSIRKSRGRERDKLDKILLTLTVGALSLSATFVGQFSNNFIEKKYLFLSWVFLILGLLSILFGYFLQNFILNDLKTV